MPEPRIYDIGKASGWSCWPDQEAGVWRWAAYGPDGRQEGLGTSEENCATQAARAREDLRRRATAATRNQKQDGEST